MWRAPELHHASRRQVHHAHARAAVQGVGEGVGAHRFVLTVCHEVHGSKHCGEGGADGGAVWCRGMWVGDGGSGMAGGLAPVELVGDGKVQGMRTGLSLVYWTG